MHLSIQLTKLEGPNVPFDHNFMLGSAVYNLLRESNEEGSSVLHDSPHRSAYVLSEIHGVRGKKEEFWFRLGTSNNSVLNLLNKAMQPGLQMCLGPTTFQITELIVEEPLVSPGEFVTLSPILLRDRETGMSIVADHKDYQATLQAAINGQINNNLDDTATVSVVRITPQAVRKRTLAGRTYLAQKARIQLNGMVEHLRFLVNHGIGSSPSLGFGMIVRDRNTPGPEPLEE